MMGLYHLEENEDQLDEIKSDVISFGQKSKVDEVWHVDLHYGDLSANNANKLNINNIWQPWT
jgi:hypothetical protein